MADWQQHLSSAIRRDNATWSALFFRLSQAHRALSAIGADISTWNNVTATINHIAVEYNKCKSSKLYYDTDKRLANAIYSLVQFSNSIVVYDRYSLYSQLNANRNILIECIAEFRTALAHAERNYASWYW